MTPESNSRIPIPPEVLFVAQYDEKISRLVAAIQSTDWSQQAVARGQVMWLLADVKLMLYAEAMEAAQPTPWRCAIEEVEAMRYNAIDFVCEVTDARVVRVGIDKGGHGQVACAT